MKISKNKWSRALKKKKITKTMSWCFEKIDKLLARLTEKRGKTQIKLEMKVTLKLMPQKQKDKRVL